MWSFEETLNLELGMPRFSTSLTLLPLVVAFFFISALAL